MQYEEVAIPEELRYTKHHLWAEINEDFCTLGWTDYIQNSAGDVNHIDLPEKGKIVEPGEDFGSIETSKWVERLYSPVKGIVVEVNDVLVQHPEMINNAPFSEGWFVRISVEGETEEEAVRFIQTCHDLGARAHLFSFFPEKGSAMSDGIQPPMEQYRRVQLARHLIHGEKSRFGDMQFQTGKIAGFGVSSNEITAVIREGTPFMTTGCPGCNRPYANETPSQAMNGLLRNFPFHPALQDPVPPDLRPKQAHAFCCWTKRNGSVSRFSVPSMYRAS